MKVVVAVDLFKGSLSSIEAGEAIKSGVLIAKKYDKPVIIFSGSVIEDAVACNEHGIDAFFPILRRIQTLQDAMDPVNAKENMIATVEQVFRLINITL